MQKINKKMIMIKCLELKSNFDLKKYRNKINQNRNIIKVVFTYLITSKILLYIIS